MNKILPKNSLYYFKYKSPIGYLYVITNKNFLLEINFSVTNNKIYKHIPDIDIVVNTTNQLDEYFKGKLSEFDIPYLVNGTILQMKIWNLLSTIEYGKVLSYKEFGNKINPNVNPRVIGNAMGKNPIPIVLPCHRVIGNDGKLHGYGGGIENKKYLLQIEKENINKFT